MSALCHVIPYLYYSALISLYLSLSLNSYTLTDFKICLLEPLYHKDCITTRQSWLFSFYVVINNKQDKTKLENITIIFFSIMYYCPFFCYTTLYSPYDLVFSRKPKLLLDLETNPNIKVSGTFKDYYTLLNKRLQYLLQDFRIRRLAMINKDRNFFQYSSGDLVYMISPLTSQLRISSRKVDIKYVGPLVVYKIIDPLPHNYL